MDDIQQILTHTEQAMHKASMHTKIACSKIQGGRATPNMLDQVMIAYYGQATSITQIASVSTPDARTLIIKPWEKDLIPEIEKAIITSQLALTPQNDGEIIRLNMPSLTEERRKILVKQVKNEGEKGRVEIRNLRREAKEAFKHLQKEGISEDRLKEAETKLQQLTDRYVQNTDQMLAHKEAEVMAV